MEAAYGRRVTGEGPMYRECLKGRVSCRYCGELMVVGSFRSHLMTQHVRVAETRRRWRILDAGAGLRTFLITFPAKEGPRSCLVEGCTGRALTKTAMRVHFLHRHVLGTAFIQEEVNLPHPQCARCNMMLTRRDLNGRHPVTAQCARGGGAEKAAASESGSEGELVAGLPGIRGTNKKYLSI